MVNKTLFSTLVPRFRPRATTANAAGGLAYERTAEQALAQLALTGCLNGTYYADAEAQLEAVVDLANRVDVEFVAKTALHARGVGRMKDAPALLLALLWMRDPGLAERIFEAVVDDARVLRAFVRIVRSGAVGRRSFGTRIKRAIRRWLASRTEERLFRESIGEAPSLADVVKMVHPAPASEERRAFYGWLVGRKHDATRLPELVRRYEDWRRAPEVPAVPDVPYSYLASAVTGTAGWTAIARSASWTTLRMNLNTFERHGVFADERVVEEVATKLRDPSRVRAAGVFPYRLLATYRSVNERMPAAIVSAIHDALEIATENVPVFPERTVVAIDVSGSMGQSVTGARGSATSKIRNVDVAGLFAAAIVRRNPKSRVLVFSDSASDLRLEPRDSVFANTERIASKLGGGTNVSSVIEKILSSRWTALPDAVVIFSDNESWIDSRRAGSTKTIEQWSLLARRNPKARLALVDLTPNRTTQALERADVMNVGGFSDEVFSLLAEFFSDHEQQRLVERIRAIELPAQ